MKKRLAALILALLMLFSASAVAEIITIGTTIYSGWYISKANFPDEIFREYLTTLSRTPDKDFLRDAVEIPEIKKIDVSKCSNPQYSWKEGKIKSVAGISKLTALKDLWVSENDLSGMNMKELLTHPSLTALSMVRTNLSGTLSVDGKSKLEALDVTGNSLTSVSINGSPMTELYVGSNKLTSLDTSGCSTLKQLHVYENPTLKSLSITANTNLEKLDCTKCGLSSLNISKNKKLKNVSCWDNSLLKLDVSKNSSLEWLDCSVNKIIELDVSGCPALADMVKNGKRQTNTAEHLDFFWDNGKQLLIDPWVTVTAGTTVSKGTVDVPDDVKKAHEKPAPSPETGTKTVTVGKAVYKIDLGSKTAEYVKPTEGKKVKKATVPATVKYGGKSYKVTKIGSKAFRGCTALTSVKVGKNVTEIGASAFEGCTKLKKFTIPAGVSKIGAKAFFKCKNLVNLIIKTTKLTLSNVGAKAFGNTAKKLTAKCPKAQKAAYKKLLVKKGANKKIKVK